MSKKITVGLASCGISAGGDAVYETFEDLIKSRGGNEIELARTGCIGSCFREVLVDYTDGETQFTYAEVTPERAKEIFEQHVVNNEPVDSYLMIEGGNNREEAFFNKQKRIVLRNTGIIDPEDIEQYIRRDGYKGI